METQATALPTRSAREQFDRQATHYDTNWNAWSEETLRWLLDNAECRPTDDVLDVATGTGFTALAFAPHVHSAIGLDVSPGMLAEARKRAQELGLINVTFQEGAAEALPFADGAFDIVTCRIAPHHFLNIRQFVSEAARVLKPGGRFALADTTVPDDAPETDSWQNAVEAVRDPSHVRNYSPGEWEQFVHAAGLTVRQITSAGNGITIPLSDWLFKAGCTQEQSDQVQQMFADAPDDARRAFQIRTTEEGEAIFTWQRVLLLAVKEEPPSPQ